MWLNGGRHTIFILIIIFSHSATATKKRHKHKIRTHESHDMGFDRTVGTGRPLRPDYMDSDHALLPDYTESGHVLQPDYTDSDHALHPDYMDSDHALLPDYMSSDHALRPDYTDSDHAQRPHYIDSAYALRPYYEHPHHSFQPDYMVQDYTNPDLDFTPGMEARLINDLMTNYSRHGRPVSDPAHPVHVTVFFHLSQLMGLDDKEQILTTCGWLEARWRDDFLVWNSSEYGGSSKVVLSSKLVWRPAISVENSATAIYDEMFSRRFHVSVSDDGDMTWTPGGRFSTTCQLDLTLYPFDEQVCHVDITDWAHNLLQVQLTNGSASMALDSYKESGEWDIVSTWAESHSIYSQLSQPLTRVRFSVHLTRKPLFYMINVITPCVTMSVLALLVFYLPPDSAEKVALGITVLLSFSVFLIQVAESVPKTSEHVPLLVIYLTLIMAMTGVSIVACVFVLHLHHMDPPTEIPRCLKYLTTRFYSRITCRKVNNDTTINGVLYRQCSPTEELHPGDVITKAGVDGGCENRGLRSTEDRSGGRRGSWVLHQLLRHLEYISGEIRDGEEQSMQETQWKDVARMLDRFLLCIFILLVTLSSVVILYIYPWRFKTQ